jgi:hypothetical protein
MFCGLFQVPRGDGHYNAHPGRSIGQGLLGGGQQSGYASEITHLPVRGLPVGGPVL